MLENNTSVCMDYQLRMWSTHIDTPYIQMRPPVTVNIVCGV